MLERDNSREEKLTSEAKSKAEKNIYIKEFANELTGQTIPLYVYLVDIKIEKSHRVINFTRGMARSDASYDELSFLFNNELFYPEFIFIDDNRIIENANVGDRLDIVAKVDKAELNNNKLTLNFIVLELVKNYGEYGALHDDRLKVVYRRK